MSDEDAMEPGDCYFFISYFDAQMRIPEIETYVYVGKNVLPDDEQSGKDIWYFQHPKTYLSHGPFHQNPPGDYGVVQVGVDVLDTTVRDFEGICATLDEIRRRWNR